jgi:DNA mismatch repair protein MSH6
MRLTPIDRIFTRVGANDRIMQGQSTFLVELEETSHILRHATPRSFVILDELGRGTSTFDGTAIAYSVIQYLSQIVQCMTLFSTHYHMLLQEYRNNPLISMYHMACKVHSGNDKAAGTADHNKHVQRITFLYKFVPGTCNKSFGLHVAALAKLPALVIDRAYEKGEWFSVCFEQPDNEPTKLLKRIIVALYHNDFFSLKKYQQQFVELQSKTQQQ